MGTEPRGDLTAILAEVHAGRADAQERLVRAIYPQLRRIAGRLMRREEPGHTLQPSALVHEALLRLLDGDALADVPNSRYLLAAAAQAMRQILVDHARRRHTAKRLGGLIRLPLDEALVAYEAQGLDVLALHDALDRLARSNPRQARVVTLRFFGGLSMAEAADALGVSLPTAERWWAFARSWLYTELLSTDGENPRNV